MPDPIIEVRDLTARYGSITILRNVSFAIQPGEVFLIVGGSGCGKSTLLKHMIGLLEPHEGDVLIRGESLIHAEGAARDAMLRRFGVLFQTGALFGSMTLAENIALPMEEFTAMPEELVRSVVQVKLGLVGLQGFGAFMPSELSGGMRKRAGLARAMALEPEILFFDEPSSGLDPVSAADLDSLILQLRDLQGTTMVIVTHDLSSIYEIADRVIMLDPAVKGIVAEGSPEELKEHPNPVVRRFFMRLSSRNNPLTTGG